MKISHRIVFGHCVRIFYKDAFAKHAKLFDEAGRQRSNNGMVNLYDKIAKLPESKREEIERDLPTPVTNIVGTGDGRSGQGHHQFPLTERHHCRRFNAGNDSHRRQDVGF